MAQQRKSYFEEKKAFNPNFFNNPTCIDDVSSNVKRIIRDAKFGLIKDEDYIFFKNQNILNVCMQIAYKNYSEAIVCLNALNYYLNNGLYSGYTPPIHNFNKMGEITNVSNAQIKFNNKAVIWDALYKIFTYINYGYDPKQMFANLESFDRKYINEL